MAKTKTTTATINKLMKENNIPATMYKGKGYYYFIINDNAKIMIDSIYTNDISSWKPEEIMEEIKWNTIHL